MLRKNNDSNQKYYTTLDSYRAGYLKTKGFIPELIDQQGKYVYLFVITPELLEALSEYDNGAEISAIRFTNAIKSLKTQIHSLRRSNEYDFTTGHQS